MKTTDFNRQHVQMPYQPRRLPYLVGHMLVYVGCLLVVLFGWWAGSKIYRISTSYTHLSHQLPALAENLTSDAPEATEAELRGLITSLETLTTELEPLLPLAPYLGWVPVYGQDLQALPILVPLGRDLGRVGADLLAAFSPLLSGSPPAAALPQLVTTLNSLQGELAQAEAALQRHTLRLETVEPAQLSDQLGPYVRQLKQAGPSLLTGLAFTRQMPHLLGAEGPRTYLLLTQNADEIRPSGGYINAAGHVTLEQGRIVEFVMQDSYAVDRLSERYPYPPEPIYRYMAADYWVLRDASWSPDFPTTAKNALALYELGQGLTADGVIALDQHALPLLLAALGPISVEGEQVTRDNVIALMRQHWAPADNQRLDAAWWVQRKSFMLSLAESVRHQLEQSPEPVEPAALLAALQQGIAEKHVQIYLNEAQGVELLSQAHASGSLYSGAGDFLMVVDANLGFNKASAIVERQTSYLLELTEAGAVESRVRLHYRHPAPARPQACSQEPRYDPVYEHNMARCYWNYVRLVVPAEAVLLSGPALVVDSRFLLRGISTTGQLERERLPHHKTSWGQLFLLAPAESLWLEYEYRLPAGTAVSNDGTQWTYALYLQKQPGTLAPPITIELTLPAGATLQASEPTPHKQQGHTLTYELTGERDLSLRVSYDLGAKAKQNLSATSK